MVTLYVVRHAQAEDAGGGRDHERPLDASGQAAAARVGRALEAHGAAPELVLCSSARRARETWAALALELPRAPAAQVEEGLYLAPATGLLERLAQLPEDCRAVLLVGHNPGLHQLVVMLAASGPPEVLARLRRGLPPGAAAALELDDGWSAIAAAQGRLAWLVAPGQAA